MTEDVTHRESEQEQLLPEGEVLRLSEWEQGVVFLFAGFSLLGGLYLLAFGPAHHGEQQALVRLLGLVWLLIGALFLQSGRAGMVADEGGFQLRGILRRRYWHWREVRSFEIIRITYMPALRVDLVDGRAVRVPGFKARSETERALADRRVAELNRRAEAARSATAITPPDGESE
jgi:hypothetical protein